MGFESLIAAAQRLSTSVEALAALGAQLRLQQDGLEGNPRVARSPERNRARRRSTIARGR